MPLKWLYQTVFHPRGVEHRVTCARDRSFNRDIDLLEWLRLYNKTMAFFLMKYIQYTF